MKRVFWKTLAVMTGVVGSLVLSPAPARADAILAGGSVPTLGQLGCLCEGFGISADGVSGYASGGAVSGLTPMSFTSSDGFSSQATSVTALAAGSLQVSHDYHPSTSSSLYEVLVTLTNPGTTDLLDVRYSRTMDWDIPPTAFAEFVTIQRGGSPLLLDSCTSAFQTPDPLVACAAAFAQETDVTDFGPGDLGRFTFAFGALGAGQSRTFRIFYGATAGEAAALAALGSVGAEVYSLGQCGGALTAGCGGPLEGTPATFVFGFSEVGGRALTAIPEPTSMVLVATGGAMAYLKRRRTRKS